MFKKKFNQMLKRLDIPSFKYLLPVNLIALYFVATKFLPYLDNLVPSPNIGVGLFALMILIIIPVYMFLFILWVLLIRQKLFKR